jgi:hypothetical protein
VHRARPESGRHLRGGGAAERATAHPVAAPHTHPPSESMVWREARRD